MKTKKMGTYKKMGLILLAGAAGGGLVGALLGAGMELYGSGLASGAGNVLSAGWNCTDPGLLPAREMC